MNREHVASVTKKDFTFEFYRSSGPGGQNVNKRSTACRVTHPDSGAVGTCQIHRSQDQNKTQAWKNCIESDKFKKWHKLFIAKAMGLVHDVEQHVDREMKNIKVEVKKDGKWVSEKENHGGSSEG